MKVKKIFCPDLMFNDYVKSCWVKNVETVEGGIPINKQLREDGEFALDIKPKNEEDYWIVGIPINKTWEPQTLKPSTLKFSIVASDSINLKITINDAKDKEIWSEDCKVDYIEEWVEKAIALPPVLENAKLLLFCGPINMVECLIKDIIMD